MQVAPLVNGQDVESIGEADQRHQERSFVECAGAAVSHPVEEPFGLVMVEAMACGTPVLGFRTGSVPELYRHGVNGSICRRPRRHGRHRRRSTGRSARLPRGTWSGTLTRRDGQCVQKRSIAGWWVAVRAAVAFGVRTMPDVTKSKTSITSWRPRHGPLVHPPCSRTAIPLPSSTRSATHRRRPR